MNSKNGSLMLNINMMKTIPVNASEEAIRELVVQWSETIAKGEFETVLHDYLHKEKWTADLLEKTIQGYGVPIHDKTLTNLLKEWNVDEFKVTSLFDIQDSDGHIQQSIQVYLTPGEDEVIGDIQYDNIPISGHISDLTARFNIKNIGNDSITLEFVDIHVM